MNTATVDRLNSSHVSNDRGRRRGSGPGSSPGSGLAGLARQLRIWRNRSRERFELKHMSDLDLTDIGLSRTDAQNEAEKPFWRD